MEPPGAADGVCRHCRSPGIVPHAKFRSRQLPGAAGGVSERERAIRKYRRQGGIDQRRRGVNVEASHVEPGDLNTRVDDVAVGQYVDAGYQRHRHGKSGGCGAGSAEAGRCLIGHVARLYAVAGWSIREPLRRPRPSPGGTFRPRF